MKGLGRIVIVSVLAVLAACGVVYKPEVLTSGCISASRALGEPIRGAKVDSHSWGPGQSTVEFLTQDTEEPRRILVECAINGSGELGELEVDGKDVEGDAFEAAREAFRAIAQSTAWSNDK